MTTVEQRMASLAKKAREAATPIGLLSTKEKDAALKALKESLVRNHDRILDANHEDIELAKKGGRPAAFIDRLKMDDSRIAAMVDGVNIIQHLKDPIGRVLEERTLHNGLRLQKVAVPIGVVLMIFEARPNVVVDAASLCLKTGNVAVLRGGSDALNTNLALMHTIHVALLHAGVPKDAVLYVEDPAHEAVDSLLLLDNDIDVVIPRGGEGLIRSVVEKSRIPVIKHYKGLCHTFIDKNAKLDMAVDIAINAKVQRPGVCNAMETLLIHHDVAQEFLTRLAPRLQEHGVEVRGCDRTKAVLVWAKKATIKDFDTEHLDLILSVKVVDDMDEAIAHIRKHGSGHSEAIVTEERKTAERFLREIDASAVFWNASTRFNDGFEFGMGAELGISTQKLHARGPMGLAELTSYKYLLRGAGQIRG
ncbi:MAG: glutamate-5-semialdehyde dehydrogenase [archaeon]